MIHWIVFNATFSYIMATSFSGGRSQSSLVNFITCGCESSAPFFGVRLWLYLHSISISQRHNSGWTEGPLVKSISLIYPWLMVNWIIFFFYFQIQNSDFLKLLPKKCGEGKTIWWAWFMVFNATFNNISVNISWQSVFLVEETEVLGENHRPVTSNWQTLSHNVVSNTPRHEQGSNSQL
jgi:hypothetical protein